jgi:hypothetical protein
MIAHQHQRRRASANQDAHKWQLHDGDYICANCGKTADETAEQDEPGVCWAQVEG